jgi:hypothetical protein
MHGKSKFQTFTFFLRTKCFHRTNTSPPPPHPTPPQLNSGHMIPWNVPPGYIELPPLPPLPLPLPHPPPPPPSPVSGPMILHIQSVCISSSFLLLECLPSLQVSKVCVNCEHKNPCRRRGRAGGGGEWDCMGKLKEEKREDWEQ